MSAKLTLPMDVLSERLAATIDGRRVRVALFTTYNFDPGFFELHILPNLFDQSFGQVDKVRLLQLEDALRAVDDLTVYYDRRALAQDAEPARLDYRRLDVRRANGAFHPKLVLLLVDEPPDDHTSENTRTHQCLIVAVQSANLTRAGWWENVECAHIEEIKDKDLSDGRCPYRRDLLAMLRRLERSAGAEERQSALEKIREFLLSRTSSEPYAIASSRGRFDTRLFGGEGRDNLSQWLKGLRLDKDEWNLEIISPYFDPGGAGPLEQLLSALKIREARVFLPMSADGTALVTESTYRAVSDLAHWAQLPGDVLERGRASGGERMTPRRVHAKVYRLWRRGGPDLVVCGSVNLTGSGHSHGGAGNLEAAFFYDAADERWPRRWWLQRDDEAVEKYADELPDESDGLEPTPIDVSIRFDWGSGALAYRIGNAISGPITMRDVAGIELFRIATPEAGDWVGCLPSAAERMREHLLSSSFVVIHYGDDYWRILVREENFAHRPSLLADLTPEEILEYWSLLTPEQRAAFLDERGGLGLELEGIPLSPTMQLGTGNSLFDRFAALYHAFGSLRRQIEAALEDDHWADAEARLIGAKYDSLPQLLEKTLNAQEVDPVVGYVTFLSARQLFDGIARSYPSFIAACGARSEGLRNLLAELPKMRARLPLDGDEQSDAFLDWFEPMFLKDLRVTGAEEVSA